MCRFFDDRPALAVSIEAKVDHAEVKAVVSKSLKCSRFRAGGGHVPITKSERGRKSPDRSFIIINDDDPVASWCVESHFVVPLPKQERISATR